MRTSTETKPTGRKWVLQKDPVQQVVFSIFMFALEQTPTLWDYDLGGVELMFSLRSVLR